MSFIHYWCSRKTDTESIQTDNLISFIKVGFEALYTLISPIETYLLDIYSYSNQWECPTPGHVPLGLGIDSLTSRVSIVRLQDPQLYDTTTPTNFAILPFCGQQNWSGNNLPGRNWWTLVGIVRLRYPSPRHGNGILFGIRFCRKSPLVRCPVPPSNLQN